MMMMMMVLLSAIWLTYERVAGLPMKRSDDGARRFWITKAGPIREELLDVQAIIVKDEEVPAGAEQCKSRNADARYSDKRHLMCAGSILTSRYILTSASCIHEATHIRHNVRAPLAAMIAPFSDTAQVIRIAEYNIHPTHQVDPRQDDHALHNVAIARLACRILKPNLKEIELPVQPASEYGDEDSCFVAVVKKIGPTSHTMYETQAKNVADERDKRELVETADEIEETSGKVSFHIDEAGKVSDTNWNKSASRAAEISEKTNNESVENNRKLNSKIVRSIGEASDKSGDRFSKNSVSEKHRVDKKLSARASDGTKGCPQTGSAVMCGNIQAKIIATSCDDRQPETTWRYTDVYDNVDWINEMLGNWKHSNQTRSGMSVGGCQTCIYNFFIDYSCKDKGMCRKEGPSGSNQNQADDLKIPGIELPKCTKNHTTDEQQQQQHNSDGLRTSFLKNKSKPANGTQSLNLAYLNAVNDMYSNKRSRNDVYGDDNQKLRTGLQDADANERKEKNDVESTDSGDMTGMVIPPPWFLDATSEPAPKESNPMPWDIEQQPAFNDYFSELDASYREAKAIGNDNAERINLNLDNKSKGRKIVSLEDFFADDKYEEAGMPDDYATLHRKFLELNKRLYRGQS